MSNNSNVPAEIPDGKKLSTPYNMLYTILYEF